MSTPKRKKKLSISLICIFYHLCRINFLYWEVIFPWFRVDLKHLRGRKFPIIRLIVVQVTCEQGQERSEGNPLVRQRSLRSPNSSVPYSPNIFSSSPEACSKAKQARFICLGSTRILDFAVRQLRLQESWRMGRQQVSLLYKSLLILFPALNSWRSYVHDRLKLTLKR